MSGRHDAHVNDWQRINSAKVLGTIRSPFRYRYNHYSLGSLKCRMVYLIQVLVLGQIPDGVSDAQLVERLAKNLCSKSNARFKFQFYIL